MGGVSLETYMESKCLEDCGRVSGGRVTESDSGFLEDHSGQDMGKERAQTLLWGWSNSNSHSDPDTFFSRS